MKDDGEDKDKGKKCDRSREPCYIIIRSCALSFLAIPC